MKMRITRFVLMAALLYGVNTETGYWTTLALFMLAFDREKWVAMVRRMES